MSGGISSRSDSCAFVPGPKVNARRLTSTAATIGSRTRSVGAVRARSFKSPTNAPRSAEVSRTTGVRLQNQACAERDRRVPCDHPDRPEAVRKGLRVVERAHPVVWIHGRAVRQPRDARHRRHLVEPKVRLGRRGGIEGDRLARPRGGERQLRQHHDAGRRNPVRGRDLCDPRLDETLGLARLRQSLGELDEELDGTVGWRREHTGTFSRRRRARRCHRVLDPGRLLHSRRHRMADATSITATRMSAGTAPRRARSARAQRGPRSRSVRGSGTAAPRRRSS